MSTLHTTNHLLDICRTGKSLHNEALDLAAQEICSFVVFHSLWDHTTDLPSKLQDRYDMLLDASQHPDKYPKDMEDELNLVEEARAEGYASEQEVQELLNKKFDEDPDDGPLVA